MRQVPCYGIIGAGRVARHFHHYFQHQGLPHRSWSRSSSNSQQTIEDLDEFLTQTDIYLILISDSQIHRFLVEHPKLLEKPCIHFSGSTQTDLAQSFHPLMTFGTELYEMEIYRSFPFVCESGEYSFSEIFPALPNPHFIIQTEQRKLYHALCVLAGNFSCLLWDKFFSDLESQFNIPRAAAQIYMNQIFKNIAQNSKNALTGPLVRGDEDTIHSNLEALNKDPYQKVYESFVSAYKNLGDGSTK